MLFVHKVDPVAVDFEFGREGYLEFPAGRPPSMAETRFQHNFGVVDLAVVQSVCDRLLLPQVLVTWTSLHDHSREHPVSTVRECSLSKSASCFERL
jgi:hypothetical protein